MKLTDLGSLLTIFIEKFIVSASCYRAGLLNVDSILSLYVAFNLISGTKNQEGEGKKGCCCSVSNLKANPQKSSKCSD